MTASAAAEIALSRRHRDAWPRVAAYDRDELRAAGRYVLVEAPAGVPTACVEYKPLEAGALDLASHQFETLRESTNPAMPLLAVQFTHPGGGHPWAFRVNPCNVLADTILDHQSWLVTEQGYVGLLYAIKHGFAAPGTHGAGADPGTVARHTAGDRAPANRYPGTCAGCGGHVAAHRGAVQRTAQGRWAVTHEHCTPGVTHGKTNISFNPARFSLEPFAHLDSTIPAVDWPRVARPRNGWANRARPVHIAAVRHFLEQHGTADRADLAAILTFPAPDRPALGAIKAELIAERAVTEATPARAEPTSEQLDHFDRARHAAAQAHAAGGTWNELASDDNREMWGSASWQRR